MRDIITIIKKELRSAFSDKIVFIQIVFVPFLIVFGYAMLMSVMNQDVTDKDKTYEAYYVNAPEYISEGLDKMGYKEAKASDVDKIKEEIKAKTDDILVIFPDDFVINVSGEGDLSDISMWYNSSKNKSLEIRSMTESFLSSMQPVAFTINMDQNETYDLGDEDYMLRRVIGTLLPVMLLMGIFMVCMNLAAETIAGDKERGFLNTMLITPVKRSHIAAGKSFSIFIIVIIGGLSAFAGLALALPKMADALGGADKAIAYSTTEYIMLFAVTLTAVFAFAGILLVISTLSKSVKQATTIAPFFMMVMMLGGMLTMSDSINDTVVKLGNVNAMIPAWNSIISMKNIIELEYSKQFILISCIVNVVFTVICIFAIGKMFENEKIVNDV